MAEEPTNELVVRILRDVQRAIGDQRAVLEGHTQRFTRLEKMLEEVRESMVTALGLAAHANIRHEGVDDRIEDLVRRVENLERRP